MNAQAVAMSGDKPTVISTFAGTGGSSLGYHWAGFKELLAIEWEDHAVECFKLNFPDIPVWQRDITTVKAQEILDFCQIKSGELDVFDGSPPCQGFSTAGKREVRDPRNRLFESYVQLVHDLQPKVFVMENVSGMAKGSMKGKFIEIIKTLKSLNYEVKAKQMNAMYYGVPQSRERIIFIGVRKDLKKGITFPAPRKTITSVQQAIGRTGYIEYRHSYSEGKFSLAKSSFSKPCLTIKKTITGWTVYPRQFNLEELCILCSFPIDWKFNGSFEEAWARLGNAVMPKFMQAIAETIKTKILEVQ
jgi:DNA (cytosine-5)-methyltransferase 1